MVRWLRNIGGFYNELRGSIESHVRYAVGNSGTGRGQSCARHEFQTLRWQVFLSHPANILLVCEILDLPLVKSIPPLEQHFFTN